MGLIINGSNNGATTVFKRLQFSYKRLKDEKLPTLSLVLCTIRRRLPD